MKTSRFQCGVSLIELMIAMAIALFLTLGLGTIFYSMTRTAQEVQGTAGSSNQGMSGLQDSERTAMQFLGNAIGMAGYYNALPVNLPDPIPTGYILPVAIAPPNMLSGTTGATPGTDTLTIKFQGNGVPGQGCSGTAVLGTLYTDTFSVVNIVNNGVSNNVLQCNENGTNYSLVNGVAGMTVLYGQDTNKTGSTTQYVPASAVANWTVLKSVYVSLTFVNPLAAQTNQPPTVPPLARTFILMNGL